MSAMISSLSRPGSRAEADAEPRANQVVRPLAEQRRLHGGVEGERRRQPVDEAGVQRELVALLALGARVVEELDEAEDPRRQVPRKRGRGDGLAEVAGRAGLADRRRPRVDLELEIPGQRDAGEEQDAEVRPAGSDRLARDRQLHERLDREARRPRLLLLPLEEAVADAEGDVA